MLKLTTPPTAEPVTTAEAKRHARVFEAFTDDDTDIDALVSAARFKFEKEAGYFLSQATYTWVPDDTLPTETRLPLRPVIADTLVITDGVTALVENTDYTVDIDADGFATVTFVSVPTDPSLVFAVGYADPTTAPALVKLALKTLVAHWYNNREAFAEKALGPVAATWESVVRSFRIA